MVLGEIAYIYADLCVQRSEPCTVVIESVLQDDQRNRQHAVVRTMLYDRFVLEVDPRRCQVQAYIAREDLYIAVKLVRSPIGKRHVDRVRLVLKAEVDMRLEPFIVVMDRGTTQEPEAEV